MNRRKLVDLVVHETKNSISAIMGYAELLKYGIIKEDDMQRFFDNICKESLRLSSLVDDVSNLVQLSSKDYEIEFEKISLREAVQEEVVQLNRAFKEDVLINVEGDAVIKADRYLIMLCIGHLLENAIIYNNSEIRQVDVDIIKNKKNTIMNISDNGIGIDKEEREAVFQCFYRIDKNKSREKGGNGLGLSVCREILTLHNASIEINGNSLGGTTVTVVL